ncbi:hypothetical protein DFP73DRAFT_525062 [Morchella snyderi]|nr:hypothetical protein DFP73DRAFT_525062 [Morchella snyderi]
MYKVMYRRRQRYGIIIYTGSTDSHNIGRNSLKLSPGPSVSCVEVCGVLVELESSHAQSEGMSRSQVVVQQESQFDSQTRTQQGSAQSQTQEDTFILPKRIWDRIGEEIAGSRASIPSAFSKAFRNIKYHASYKATKLMNFMHLISPIVLNQRLPAMYYSHWHHFVLASEKAGWYQLNMEDVAEIEQDMVQVMTGYDHLYYQYKLFKIRGCTTQVRGQLRLGMAMKVCGPNPIYHQYLMEKTCGTIKLLERERLRYLPLIVLLSMRESVPTSFSETAERRLFRLEEKNKVAYPAEYPDCLLMGPKVSRRLTQYKRNNLSQFHADVIVLFSGIFKLSGRAVARRVLSNSSEHEVIGSAISNPKPGVCSSRRNDSCVRYILTGELDGDNDVSYFGKVMFFMPYEIHNDERLEDKPERFMMA